MPFIVFIALLALVVAAWLIGPNLWVRQRRARLRRRPFPAAWRGILRRRMPYFARLPPDLQRRLEKHVQVFVAEVSFVGCGGLELRDEMRVLVAAQAALLLLARPQSGFANLREVLMYPGAFVVERAESDPLGLVHEGRRVLSGESWQRGQVILSWDDVLQGAADPDDGHNVVIHEFAHQLDQESGRANGAPFLGRLDRYAGWSQTMSAAYAQLRRRVGAGEETLIDAYGASNPAEFFAVASELFFEKPRALSEEEPGLYRELAGYYGVDPLQWR